MISSSDKIYLICSFQPHITYVLIRTTSWIKSLERGVLSQENSTPDIHCFQFDQSYTIRRQIYEVTQKLEWGIPLELTIHRRMANWAA